MLEPRDGTPSVGDSDDPRGVPRPGSKRRRRLKIALTVVISLYLLIAVSGCMLQSLLIFPGAYVHGPQAKDIVAPPGGRIVSLRTRTGDQITALFGPALTADGLPRTDAANLPTILFFYGNGDCIQTSIAPFDMLRRLGANVLIPEYVGYPASSGEPSEVGCYATADAAYQYLFTCKDVDPRQIVVLGRSIGSGSAIDLASREPVAGLVTISAFTTMDVMARREMPFLPTSWFLRSHFDNLSKIGRVKCPVFLAHGTKDELVPFSMMAELAAHTHTATTTYAIVGASHNGVFRQDPPGLSAALRGFLEGIHDRVVASRNRSDPQRAGS